MRALFLFFILASAEYIVQFTHSHSDISSVYIPDKGGEKDFKHFSNVQDLEAWLNTYNGDYANERIIYSVQKIIKPELTKTEETRMVMKMVEVPEEIYKWKIKQDL